MARYQIVLADRDESYISILELRFLEHFGDVADIRLISDLDYFHSFFSTPQRVDMLILSQELYEPELARHNIGVLVQLSELPLSGTESGDDGITLYKYTSMKELFADLAPFLAGTGDRAQEGGTQILAVYSPVGGMGSTSIALGLCAALHKNHRRVFYLNTETVQTFPALLPDCAKTVPSDFRTGLLTQSPRLTELLPAATGNAGFDYLLPFDHSIATYGISLAHFSYLASCLRQEGRYQYLVIDCSSEFTQEKSLLMSQCDRVLMLTGQTAGACRKTEALLQDLNVRDSDRFLFVCNRYRGDEEDHLKDNLLGKISIADYVPLLPPDTCRHLEGLAGAEALGRLALRVL